MKATESLSEGAYGRSELSFSKIGDSEATAVRGSCGLGGALAAAASGNGEERVQGVLTARPPPYHPAGL